MRIFGRIADNGTAALRRVLPFAKPSDVRSPAGRVHRFGKPPSRCTKAHALGCDWAGFRTSEKVFAKGGLNWTKSSISTNRSECFFRGTKLRKNCGTKKQARLNATNSSIKYSTPPFANTMLAVVTL